jgi:hypothetical protein
VAATAYFADIEK